MPVRSTSGFSLVELIVALASGLVIMASTGALVNHYASWQNAPNGKAAVLNTVAELKTMLNLTDATIGPNQNCAVTFGPTQTVHSTVTKAYDLYRPDGSTFLYGTPTPSQNLITPQWQITSVRLVPYGHSQSWIQGEHLVFANLTISAHSVTGTDGTADESMPLVFVLNSTGNVIGCSSGSISSTNVVRLPACVPGQHLLFYPPSPGHQPVWMCQ